MSKGISGLFVGTTGWTVQTTGRLIPGQDGVVTGGSSEKLKGNLMQNMGLLKSTSSKGYQAQHIIPHEMANHPILQKIGMDLDDASNGILLPIPKGNVSTLSRHRGYHSIYSEFVRKQLNKINPNQKKIKIYQFLY